MYKTSNGRYIEKRVKINKKLLKEILFKIKKFNNLTWKDLANNLGLCEQSVRNDWIEKGNSIPYSIFKRLLNLHPKLDYKDIKDQIKILEPFWGQKIGIKSRIEYKLKIPNVKSKEFAEFYGIMLGDGCVYSNLSGICISSDSLTDKQYNKEYISRLVNNLFGIYPKIYYSKEERVMRCVLYSRKVANFMVNLGFPRGKKIYGDPKILEIFFKNRLLLSSCIRGLFDTDGTVCPHPNTKIMLSISITYDTLLKSSINAFKILKVQIGNYNKGLNMYGKKKVGQYFKKIGSSNIKHITKYKSFINHGFVPKNREIENLLKNKNKEMMKLPYMGS